MVARVGTTVARFDARLILLMHDGAPFQGEYSGGSRHAARIAAADAAVSTRWPDGRGQAIITRPIVAAQSSQQTLRQSALPRKAAQARTQVCRPHAAWCTSEQQAKPMVLVVGMNFMKRCKSALARRGNCLARLRWDNANITATKAACCRRPNWHRKGSRKRLWRSNASRGRRVRGPIAVKPMTARWNRRIDRACGPCAGRGA